MFANVDPRKRRSHAFQHLPCLGWTSTVDKPRHSMQSVRQGGFHEFLLFMLDRCDAKKEITAGYIAANLFRMALSSMYTSKVTQKNKKKNNIKENTRHVQNQFTFYD